MSPPAARQDEGIDAAKGTAKNYFQRTSQLTTIYKQLRIGQMTVSKQQDGNPIYRLLQFLSHTTFITPRRAH